MADSPNLPGDRAWRDASGKPLPIEFWRFLRDLTTFVRTATGNTTDIASLLARIVALEDAPANDAEISGPSSVAVFGTLADGSVVVQFTNDDDAPGNTYRYGTGPTGAKGWLPVSGDFVEGAGLEFTIGTDGLLTIALNAASIASLLLADSAVQPADLTPYATVAAPIFTGLVNAVDDTAAASGGVPLGGLYHNAGAARIRLV